MQIDEALVREDVSLKNGDMRLVFQLVSFKQYICISAVTDIFHQILSRFFLYNKSIILVNQLLKQEVKNRPNSVYRKLKGLNNLEVDNFRNGVHMNTIDNVKYSNVITVYHQMLTSQEPQDIINKQRMRSYHLMWKLRIPISISPQVLRCGLR